MKLKYYLRGVGIGIIVTAIILSVTNQPEKLTDAQIKMRALELGMVEENVLADLNDKTKDLDEDSEKSNVNEEDIVSSEEETSEELEETKDNIDEVQSQETLEEEKAEGELENNEIQNDTAVSVNEEKEAVSEKNQEEEEAESAPGNINNNIEEIQMERVENYIIISVEQGNDSVVVSQKLFEAGLINSTVEYNNFLVQNGYDRRLRTGNHEIPINATNEDMAKILCGIP